jgi:inhibitor of KinA
MQTIDMPYTIHPLGDMALTVAFGNVIDSNINKQVLAIFERLQQLAFPFVLDVVPAYSSISIYYDVAQVLHHTNEYRTAFDAMSVLMENVITFTDALPEESTRLIKIPVCYSAEYGPDTAAIAKGKEISVETLIQIHTSKNYRVYMVGFLPGFPYLGEVDDRIAVPRKAQPRLKVEKGAVGIAGKQTGIYPQSSPGGWQIIGRTPIELFDSSNETPSLLRPGDTVQFYSITAHEFAHYKSRTA